MTKETLSAWTLREVYILWLSVNPCDFQRLLLAQLSTVCHKFGELNDRPYASLTDEEIESSIQKTASVRRQQEMRFLIQMLDRFISEQEGVTLVRQKAVA